MKPTSEIIRTLLFECEDKWQACIAKSLEDICAIEVVSTEDRFKQKLKRTSYDVVILDLPVHNENAFDLIRWLHTTYPSTPIIAVSNSTETDFVVQAVKLGAYDFVTKPFSREKIRHVINQALENRSLRHERDYLRRNQDVIYNFDDIIAESPSMKALIEHLKKFSESDSIILMTGETGSGKSFLSGTVHFNSPRRQKPFIIINCANILDTLLESELFGHEKGAFTGADKQRIGRFEQAKGGTVFLDEIGEMSLSLQAKLLRVLEERCFERVGGRETISPDIRFIAATNQNLDESVANGLLRQDLYYRIKGLAVTIPPLRERRACIEPLSNYFLEKICRNLKKRVKRFSPEVLRLIKTYHWPGNIRELSNSIERAVILEDTATLRAKHFPFPNACHAPSTSPEAAEREMIIQALEKSLWIQKDAAALLGMSPRKLNYRIKKFGIKHPRWRKHS